MLKLTPTTNDQVKNGRLIAPAHIVEAHEPLRTGEVVIPVIPVQEQIVNEVIKPQQKQELKIALIGTAPSSRHLAPYNDPSWKIWACSAGNMGQVPRVDAWFEIHSNLLWPENEHFGRPYINWLNSQTFPVYMQTNTTVPRATSLPVHELIEEFGGDFFTSSFAWMMAFAIKQGATEIALFGIDMASRDEYILQRPGFYFFRHEAERRGIKVSAPNESDIMQSPPLYGYVDSTPFGRKIAARKKELKDRIGPMKAQFESLAKNITYLEGALEDIDYIENIWAGVQRPPKET